jgi:hypothetical protein
LVLVEVGRSQVPAVVEALARSGLMPRIVADDEIGALVATGRR